MATGTVPLQKSTPTSANIASVAAIVTELPEAAAFKTALLYSVSILILPVLAFFIPKILIFDGILSLSVVTSNICSALCAVVVLHICLGAFIYKAYCGPEKATKTE